MRETMNFYMDESGTRDVNRMPGRVDSSNRHFAFGGVLIREEDEPAAKNLYDAFVEKWDIRYPLHSVKIRGCNDNFRWLVRGTAEYSAFMTELSDLLCSMKVIGVACVVDRAGYEARYKARYPELWTLCKTAFGIAVERAAKYARRHSRRLSVYPEHCGKNENKLLREYLRSMRTQGMPFDPRNAGIYSPLTAAELDETLYDFKIKPKKSRLVQIADLMLWPLVRMGYDKSPYPPYDNLKAAGRWIECELNPCDHLICGTKYSCFDQTPPTPKKDTPETTKAQAIA